MSDVSTAFLFGVVSTQRSCLSVLSVSNPLPVYFFCAFPCILALQSQEFKIRSTPSFLFFRKGESSIACFGAGLGLGLVGWLVVYGVHSCLQVLTSLGHAESSSSVPCCVVLCYASHLSTLFQPTTLNPLSLSLPCR